MDLNYSDEQIMLRESVNRFVREEYSFQRRQKLLATEAGYSEETWRQYAELGWLSMPFAEEDGGMGGTAVDVALVMEGIGRGLILEPYLSSIMAGRAVARLGSPAQKANCLAALMEGRIKAALAFAESQSRYDLRDCRTTATANGAGFSIRGHKSVVLGGHAADTFVVVARTGGSQTDEIGLSFFLLDRNDRGLEIKRYRTNDGTGAAELILRDVAVSGDRLLGSAGNALEALEEVVDFGIACVAAEATGIMDELCAVTLNYLKTRKQFGKTLGDNQALQHRMVDMVIATEEARSSALHAALTMLEPERSSRLRAMSLAKIEIGRTGTKVGQEAVQLHGAMGVTEELAVGHFFKRLTAIGAIFGDSGWHTHRINSLDDSALRQRA